MTALTTEQPPAGGTKLGQVDWGWATVVVVDDDETCRELLLAIVRKFGVGRILQAADGVDCLEKLEGVVPDLIISDISMPRMDGVELTRHIRERSEYADVPILIQTGSVGIEKHLNCFNAGASDVLTKPVRPSELRARMRVHLENRRLVYNLRKADRRITRELEGARRMQAALMPKPKVFDHIKNKFGVIVEGEVNPTSTIGGDFWGLIDIDDYAFGIYTVDFSGHGVMSALNTFRFHAVINEMAANHRDPASFLVSLNDVLVALLPRGQYATFFYGVIDTLRNTLTWAGAGAPFPLLVRGEKDRLIDTTGTPLGLVAKSEYYNSMLPFPLGSALFIYSDGMIEAERKDGGEVGEVAPFVRAAGSNIMNVTLPGILQEFTQVAQLPLNDDLTAIWVRHEGGEQRHYWQLDPSLRDDSENAVEKIAVGRQANLLMIENADHASVSSALDMSNAVVEIGNGDFALRPEYIHAVSEGAVLLSMTTLSAYRHSPCAKICHTLVDRGWMLLAQHEDALLAFQEAMANAVIHGNLELQSPNHNGRSIREYWKDLKARLEDPILTQRRITILAQMKGSTLYLSLEDQGKGFTKREELPVILPTNTSGRGETLMTHLTSSLHWELGGRRVVMSFTFSEIFS